MIHGIDPSVINNDIIYIVMVPILTYILKVILKPSGVEVTYIARGLSFAIVGTIKMLSMWIGKHNPHASEQLKAVQREMIVFTNKFRKQKPVG